MIFRPDATQDRSFARLVVDVGFPRTINGASGSGETKVFDLPCLLDDLVGTKNIADAVMSRWHDRSDPPRRAGSLEGLVYALRSIKFPGATVDPCGDRFKAWVPNEGNA